MAILKSEEDLKILFLLEEFKCNELNKLAKSVSLDEDIDYKCKFMTATQGDKIIGVVGVNFHKELPRLEHIILDKKHQRTRLGVVLLRKMEEYLVRLKYKQYYSYIMNNNERMKKYAQKWGMKLTKIGEFGSWYYKGLERV